MTAHKEGDPTTLNRLYGRSSGHKLRKGQAELVETLLPAIAVPAEGEITSERLFGDDRPLHLEIGFGGGEHLAYRADLLPDHGFIGCEPFLNGVATMLGHVRDQRLANVRIHMGDALDVLRRLPDQSLTMVYLLHPDPWPKARHAKRRMMNDGPLDADRRQDEAGRRVPRRDRRSDLFELVADGHAAPRRPVRMGGEGAGRVASLSVGLAGNPLRRQGPARRPHAAPVPLPAPWLTTSAWAARP